MHLPPPCGPVSRQMSTVILGAGPEPTAVPVAAPDAAEVLRDRDVQLALWMAYELSYRGFDGVDDRQEWSPEVLRLRTTLEDLLEQDLRAATRARLEGAGVGGQADGPVDGSVGDSVGGSVGDRLLRLVEDDDGPHLSAYLRREATWEQMSDFLRERSVQQLKESDPQSFLLPRLEGAAKVALAEIQYDEYGAGRPEGLHQHLFAQALQSVGLDPTYGAYASEVSAISLASANVMSLFTLNRRLRACGIGHFAAFEASSSVPSRRIASGMERLGMPEAAATYFLEHVEADSVHEQVAARDLCGSFVEQHPTSVDDVLFGAACALHLDALSGAELLDRWASDGVSEGLAS
jgi:hypothetical protein